MKVFKALDITPRLIGEYIWVTSQTISVRGVLRGFSIETMEMGVDNMGGDSFPDITVQYIEADIGVHRLTLRGSERVEIVDQVEEVEE